MHVLVLFNRAAGNPAAHDGKPDLHDLLTQAGLRAELREVAGPALAVAAREGAASGYDAVVAAGGDGTVSTVAAALVHTRTPLGILPLGTLNHFAKDLGIPVDPHGAVATLAQGATRDVDLGAVNGRPFINNASIGLYPHMVLDRERRRERLRRGRWPATAWAAFTAFRRFPLVRVRIHLEEATLERTTPFVFIGNNAYHMNGLTLGSRPRLDEGVLSLYLTTRTGRLALVGLAARKVAGRLDQARDFDSLRIPEAWIEAHRDHLHVAIDGEVESLRPPLHLQALPGALRVVAPPRPKETRAP